MTNYRRQRIKGGCYFFTVNLADRRQTLLTDRIAILRQAFRQTQTAHPFTIEAIVILPDHLHAIWTLPEGDDDFSLRWRQIKAAFSRAVAKGEVLSPSRKAKAERGIWQRRFWEHAIRDDADYGAHVDYIHYNPVKHGHAERVADWPYSSFQRFVSRGVYPADWAGGNIPQLDLG